ncbi:RES family NAD+ phosphorylase [Paramicrobacterium fandaimingii]|uniref:RES family NAD+ phosphorylase n=1 Tax=Paramicrobacterium fandaimingii TaxID=2708079 RepID=UPI001F2370D5|nr:RES family NAD+ phosphorylase [Microbacterium fandaimingii]
MTGDELTRALVIRGTFYRAIDPSFRQFAIAGSRSAGRYSRPHQPTLYLSSSVEGVEAAMIAHRDQRSPALEVMAVEVEARSIVDLRDTAALEATGVTFADAIAPWQETVASGGTPSSWAVRDTLVARGANGLIDPSRKKPGLWHLVLFRWNEADAPTVRLAK